MLLGVTDSPRFADNGYFHLSGVGHLVLDALGNVERDTFCLGVGDFLAPHHNAQLAACLDGIGLHHAVVRKGKVFHVFQALDVGFHNLAACAGACAGNGVAGLHDGGDEGGHLDFLVVGADSVADIRFFFVFFSQLHAKDSVREFRLVVRHFADVVQETGTFCFLDVQAQFRCHDGAEVRRLAGVLQKVLPVRRAVFHFSDEADKFRMQPVDTQVYGRALAGLDDFLLDLFFHFVDNLFDACGVDTSVRNQLVERQACDFPADGVKA